MTKEQFEIWGRHYYHAFDHTVMVDHLLDRVGKLAWCVENIGEDSRDWQWNYNSYRNSLVFGFRRAEDATAFALRWA